MVATPFRRYAGRPLLLIAILGAAIAEACSLFIPFDDYRPDEQAFGPGGPDGDVTRNDGGTESDVVDEDGRVNRCIGIDARSDPQNCGTCGRECVTGGLCTEGRCPVETLSSPDAGSTTTMVLSIFADKTPNDAGDAVYLSRSNGQVSRVRLLTPLSEENVPGTNTYFASGSVHVSANGTQGFYRATVTGVAEPAIASFTHANFTSATPKFIYKAADLGPHLFAGNYLYVGSDAGVNWFASGGQGVREDAGITGTEPSPPPVAFTTYGSNIYWTNATGEVWQMPAATPDNKALVVRAPEIQGVIAIAISKRNVYLAQRGQGLLMYAFDAVDRKADEKKFSSVQMPNIETVVSDNNHVYILDNSAQKGRARLLRTELDGSELITLADGLTAARGLYVFRDWVYFADGDKLLRTSK